MSEIALELYQVLEDEYVSTGGEVAPSPDDAFTTADVLDFAAAAARLGVKEAAVVARLGQLRINVDQTDAGHATALLGASEKLTPGTKRLLDSYGTATDKVRRRINRRVLEDVFGDTLRAAKPLSDIAADQIVNTDSCRATLQSYLRGDYETATELASTLELLRLLTDVADERCPATLFGKSSRLASSTALLVHDYVSISDDETRRTIN